MNTLTEEESVATLKKKVFRNTCGGRNKGQETSKLEMMEMSSLKENRLPTNMYVLMQFHL